MLSENAGREENKEDNRTEYVHLRVAAPQTNQGRLRTQCLHVGSAVACSVAHDPAFHVCGGGRVPRRCIAIGKRERESEREKGKGRKEIRIRILVRALIRWCIVRRCDSLPS